MFPAHALAHGFLPCMHPSSLSLMIIYSLWPTFNPSKQMLLFPLSLFLPSYVLQQLCFLSSQPTSHCGAFLTQLAPGQHSHRCQSRSVQECITHSTWRRGKASLGLGKQLVQHSHLVAKSKMATKTHMVEPWEIPQPPICASAVWAAFKHLSVQNKMMTSTGTKQLFRTTSS